MQQKNTLKIITFTTLALIAFAANSILCRLAIGSDTIDPTSFTIIRLLSGMVMLWLLSYRYQKSQTKQRSTRWLPALMLFTYAACFSYAYTLLDTGVGALVLFGVVQITVVLVSLYSGERLALVQWLGLLMAFSGLVYLLMPHQVSHQASISYVGYCLMVLSGIAWAWYTLLGRASTDPLLDTSHNFFKAAVISLTLLAVFFVRPADFSVKGIFLSVVAGAITSGLGYAIWYQALQGLSKVQAGVLQLSVPLMAAVGGVLVMGESFTTTLTVSLGIVISGIFLVLYKRA